jgi:hypothetical protein
VYGFVTFVYGFVIFVCGDSAGMRSHICIFNHFVQLFLYLDPMVLKDIINMAKYKRYYKRKTKR